MLKSIELENVGPAPTMRVDLAPRLNVLTGDNGVGKSFLLEVAWYCLTGTWAGLAAMPGANRLRPEVRSTYEPTGQWFSRFRFHDQSWEPFASGGLACLAIYAEVNGGFALYDPTPGRASVVTRLDADTLWNGLREGGKSICNGLVQDVAQWFAERAAITSSADEVHAYTILENVVKELAPPDSGGMTLERPARVFLDDVRLFPHVRMGYGSVPLVHAAAAVKRVVCLAYALVWTWVQHREAARLSGAGRLDRLVLLIDEIETHLHPQWQRAILPSLVDTLDRLGGVSSRPSLQVIATTHSPLVLASLEPIFDTARDALILLDLEGDKVVVKPQAWRPRGDASAWLTSEIFGLKQARSREAEAAIGKARAAMLEPNLSTAEAAKVHDELAKVLKDVDPFWVGWLVKANKSGLAL